MILFRYLLAIILVFSFSLSSVSQYISPKPLMSQKVFKKFKKIHIDYPEKELLNKTQGTVIIGFDIDNEGNIKNYKVTHGVSNSIDSAAISIFNRILWNPAFDLGKPIDGTSEFEIKYNVKNYKKIVKRRGYNHIPKPKYPMDNSKVIHNKNNLDTVPEPILPSGVKSLNKYIYSNLTYPEAANKLALSGVVELSFIIEANGLPSNIIVIKRLGGGCTEEAIRIIESIIWQPGVKNKKSVRTKYSISIDFKKGDGHNGHIPNQQGSGI